MTKNRKANEVNEVKAAEEAQPEASTNETPEIVTGERSETGFYIPRGKSDELANAELFGARSPRWCPPCLFVGKHPESGAFGFLTASLAPLDKYFYENWRDMVAVAKAARALIADPANNRTRIYQIMEQAEIAALPHLAEERAAEIKAREAAKRQRKLGVKVRETKSGDVTLQVTPAIMNQYVEHCIAHPGSSLAAFLENLGVADIPNLPKVAPDPAEAAKPDGPLNEAEVQAMK